MATATSNNVSHPTNGHTNGDGTKIHKDPNPKQPFLGQQPYGMPDDLVIPKIMDLENTDEKLWVCSSIKI